MDYRAWVERVRNFPETLRRLPGEIHYTVEIDSPLSEANVAKLELSWSNGVPAALANLWIRGSGRVSCRYIWEPPPDGLPRLREVFPSQTRLYGGPRFEPAHQIFPRNSGADSHDEKILRTLGRRDLDLWCSSALFLHVGNGDCLGLDTYADPANPPVVYLFHDQPGSEQISRTLDDFIQDWTELAFVGPELWLLDSWVDRGTGKLDLAKHKTAGLRNLFGLCAMD